MNHAAASNITTTRTQQPSATGDVNAHAGDVSPLEVISLEEIARALDDIRNDVRLPLALRMSVPEISPMLRELSFYRLPSGQALMLTKGHATLAEYEGPELETPNADEEAWIALRCGFPGSSRNQPTTAASPEKPDGPSLDTLSFHFDFFSELPQHAGWMDVLDPRLWQLMQAVYEIPRGEWDRADPTEPHGARCKLHSTVILDVDDSSVLVPNSPGDSLFSEVRGLQPGDRFFWSSDELQLHRLKTQTRGGIAAAVLTFSPMRIRFIDS